jgi:hypothetical protein
MQSIVMRFNVVNVLYCRRAGAGMSTAHSSKPAYSVSELQRASEAKEAGFEYIMAPETAKPAEGGAFSYAHNCST